MKLLALPLLAAMLTCGSAVPPDPLPNGDSGTIIWSPRIHEGTRIAAAIRLPDGTLKVFIAAEHRYQYATTSSVSYGGDKMVYVTLYEVTRKPLKSPATHPGWRDPARVHNYPVHDFDAVAKGAADLPSFLAIYTDGTNWLIEVIVIKPLPRAEEVMREASK